MNFLLNWWDILIFLLLSVINLVVWLSIKDKLPKKTSVAELPANLAEKNVALQERNVNLQERQLAATIINNSSTSGITAVSILIPASLLIVQLGFGTKPIPPEALQNVFRASMWFLLSLLLGLYIIFNTAMRSQTRNVTQYFPVGVVFAPQLFALGVGVIRFVVAITFVVSIR